MYLRRSGYCAGNGDERGAEVIDYWIPVTHKSVTHLYVDSTSTSGYNSFASHSKLRTNEARSLIAII